ncbi:MAG: SMP-30/gluconolactonase/LRE family protein [Candidatus Hydrogenedentes bacterium]|nr:SMP-30/gluconolactonase/LRE family protein [Candidatus Hydrogenedentota bacterium]
MLSAFIFLSAVALADESPLTIGEVELVAEGFLFTEGPLWISGSGVVFSDIPADTVYRSDKSVFRKPSGKSNGLALDSEGRLLSCEHGSRSVTRVEKDGSVTVIADNYQGKKFSSPNDLAIRSDGMIFFADPPFGLGGREAELDINGVYSVVPGGKPRLLLEDSPRPNGLAFSPDEKTLYVADTQEGQIRAFDVAADGSLSGGRKLADVPAPDGIRVDADGRVWSSSSLGVVVFDESGATAQTITFPQQPSNVAFGGKDGKTLYVTARTAVYKIQTSVAGSK